MRTMNEKPARAPLTVRKSVVYDARVGARRKKRVRSKEAGPWDMR